MDSVMTRAAQEREVVDVGLTLGRGVPGHDVMRFAMHPAGVTKNTASVTDNEREHLAVRSTPSLPPEPQGRPSQMVGDEHRQVRPLED